MDRMQQDYTAPGTVILFGPQEVAFTYESVARTRKALRGQQWAVNALADLPSLWERAAAAVPILRCLPGHRHLRALQTWLTEDTPASEDICHSSPNIILSPFTTLSQLLQYHKFKESRHPGTDIKLPRGTATLGFCTGTLAAFAVSASNNIEEWNRNAAAAVRLAALVGAVVDAEEVIGGATESYAVAWPAGEGGRRQLETIIKQYNGHNASYVSVWYDENRATITIPQRTESEVLSLLRAAGMTVATTSLRGRFHSARHEESLNLLLRLCEQEKEILEISERLVTPPCAIDPVTGPHQGLHETALRAILVRQCHWYETLSRIVHSGNRCRLLSLSNRWSVPPSLMRELGAPIEQFNWVDNKHPKIPMENLESTPANARFHTCDDRDIAIVGMSVKVAGADDVAEYDELLRSGQSQHQQVLPGGRVNLSHSPWRSDSEDPVWYGNFVRDADAFDHKFFRKSPRESAAMDPQQRLFLQAAYQAVEQSGYYRHGPTSNGEKHVGVYIATCATDYDYNAACHNAGAFTVTGLLKGFAAGRVSHHFGWTGPAMTFDTACSGSAVAIHTAVRALITGECSSALAGGVNIIGNVIWYQNLAGAQFLSPTGQCKPFDDAADGYCRGEGISCVFLKPMAKAVEDGDQIFGRIASTAVYQNDNCVPMFVPHSPSLAKLFQDVVAKAGLTPREISFVEAHGTGTPVGDQAEYAAIRKVFADGRQQPVKLGSAKGFVGHTESASGVVSLVKILIMIHRGFIPPQASYSETSHRIDAAQSDMIELPKTLAAWSTEHKAALLNNYGASGSNAAMVVMQTPMPVSPSWPDGLNLPFWITGFDQRSIIGYCAKLAAFIKSKGDGLLMTDLSFNVSRQSNRGLPFALHLRCRSTAEIMHCLTTIDASQIVKVKPVRPVILCFGGQNSTSVNLDHRVVEFVPVFRRHLDRCNAVIVSHGLPSIYPDIYSKSPVGDVVHLQTMLFAVQYACAKTWIDCGLDVQAVVGQSFGEITAVCIAQVLDLEDAIRLVAGRAKIVRDSWGSDSGAMIVVEGDLNLVQQLLIESNRLGTSPANIACYNSATSFTLAGSTAAMERVKKVLTTDEYKSLESKKLNVTNAFHSVLVEPLWEDLHKLGLTLKFHEPTIRVERAVETPSSALNAKFVPDHMRNPTFFSHATRRLAKVFPSAVWVEAGSASKITSMVRRSVSTGDSHFQGVDLTRNCGLEQITQCTLGLWKEGLPVTFWPQHGANHPPLLLPPYQFEKSRHWLDVKPITLAQDQKLGNDSSYGLWSFCGFQDADKRRALFRINTESPRYKAFVLPHVAAQTAPLCPATLEYHMAIEAARTLCDGRDLYPIIREMRNNSPLCLGSSRSAWIELWSQGKEWTWKIMTTSLGEPPSSSNATLCVLGKVEFLQNKQALETFARFEQGVSHGACVDILEDDDSDGIQGGSIYRALADVVDYGGLFRHVRRVAARGNECAGIVHCGKERTTWLDEIPIADAVAQVAGVWVNCMDQRSPGDDDMFLATGCEVIMNRSKRHEGSTWRVLTKHRHQSDRAVLTDIFAFDTEGRLSEVMLGIRYSRIPKASMSRLLTKLTEAEQPPRTDNIESSPGASSQLGVVDKIKAVIASVSGVEAVEINNDSELAALGIDSLAAMELRGEVETAFGCKLDLSELLLAATTFAEFAAHLTRSIGTEDMDSDGSSSATNASSNSIDAARTQTSTYDSDSQEVKEVLESPNNPQRGKTLFSPQSVFDAFEKVKDTCDQRIKDYGLYDTDAVVLARSNRLCVALVVEAFEQLGCPLRNVKTGRRIERIQHAPEHTHLVDWLYKFLERDGRLIDIDGPRITRSNNAVPPQSSDDVFNELVSAKDKWLVSHKVTNYAGKHLADVVSGRKDAIHVLFGSQEGRDLVRGLYCDLPFNRLSYEQIRDTIRLAAERLSDSDGTLRILEMGAGTGGTTRCLAPMLEQLNVPVEYTFTDLSPSMVAQARRIFEAQYPFMRFAVHDIEKPPSEVLREQDIVVASNAVHATANLSESLENIAQALQPGGVLVMTEMTESLPFVDVVFGLLEGWWRFADGREHAIVSAEHWGEQLRKAGFYADWTNGCLSENRIQKVLLGVKGETPDRSAVAVQPDPASEVLGAKQESLCELEKEVESFVRQYSANFGNQLTSDVPGREEGHGAVVIVTGATGSLGSHLVARLARDPTVKRVVCLNRRHGKSPLEHQLSALSSRGISLSEAVASKLQVLATDVTELRLGLQPDVYAELVTCGTHIVHNAWPMSATRPLRAFEPQFRSMRRLLDLAADISASQISPIRVCFQLVSSIGVVGHSTLDRPTVLEDRVPFSSVLPNGYCRAKWVCERVLDETLHRHPRKFRAMTIRLGQIAGSSTSGFWNPVEHFPFLVRSTQALRAFPALTGRLQWVPVDVVAGTAADLALGKADEPVYHIDNPVGQQWEDMAPVLAEALGADIVPYQEWIRRVRRSPLDMENENPAARLADFFEQDFRRMSCGGIVLDTAKACCASPTLASQGPVSASMARKYIKEWKAMGFLK